MSAGAVYTLHKGGKYEVFLGARGRIELHGAVADIKLTGVELQFRSLRVGTGDWKVVLDGVVLEVNETGAYVAIERYSKSSLVSTSGPFRTEPLVGKGKKSRVHLEIPGLVKLGIMDIPLPVDIEIDPEEEGAWVRELGKDTHLSPGIDDSEGVVVLSAGAPGQKPRRFDVGNLSEPE